MSYIYIVLLYITVFSIIDDGCDFNYMQLFNLSNYIYKNANYSTDDARRDDDSRIFISK